MSEGKILASDRCGRELQQGSVLKGVQGGWGLGRDDTGLEQKIGGECHKNKATSRRSGQRRDVPERTFSNVATLRPTSRRSREESVPTSRHSIQRRDVPENVKNQRRDVGDQRRDVPEEFKINFATLDINVATFQRRSKSTS